MKFFASLSSHPGKMGMYYYSKFFEYYKFSGQYEALSVNDVNQLKIHLSNNILSGINISSPFKRSVLKYLDQMDPDVVNYETCNTIKFLNGELHGFNTDLLGVKKIVSNISKKDFVLILGNGAMGKMFGKFLDAKTIKHMIVSPSLSNWVDRHHQCDIIINCTTLGTSSNQSPINKIGRAHTVYDLTFNGTELKKISSSIKYLSGIYFYKYSFLTQFAIHTGITPNPEIFDSFTSLRVE